jgi:hypothetical protein
VPLDARPNLPEVEGAKLANSSSGKLSFNMKEFYSAGTLQCYLELTTTSSRLKYKKEETVKGVSRFTERAK